MNLQPARSFHKVCTLEKEGITSSSTKKRHFVVPRHCHPVFSGSTQKSADQPRLFEVLPKDQWFHIGDGWLQSTATGTGTLFRCGLHTIFESNPGNVYMCIYEPRSVEAHEACTASAPEYDLEFSTKLIKFNERKAEHSRLTGFHAIIAYKNESNFVSFMYSPNKKWFEIYFRYYFLNITYGFIDPNSSAGGSAIASMAQRLFLPYKKMKQLNTTCSCVFWFKFAGRA